MSSAGSFSVFGSPRVAQYSNPVSAVGIVLAVAAVAALIFCLSAPGLPHEIRFLAIPFAVTAGVGMGIARFGGRQGKAYERLEQPASKAEELARGQLGIRSSFVAFFVPPQWEKAVRNLELLQMSPERLRDSIRTLKKIQRDKKISDEKMLSLVQMLVEFSARGVREGRRDTGIWNVFSTIQLSSFFDVISSDFLFLDKIDILKSHFGDVLYHFCLSCHRSGSNRKHEERVELQLKHCIIKIVSISDEQMICLARNCQDLTDFATILTRNGGRYRDASGDADRLWTLRYQILQYMQDVECKDVDSLDTARMEIQSMIADAVERHKCLQGLATLQAQSHILCKILETLRQNRLQAQNIIKNAQSILAFSLSERQSLDKISSIVDFLARIRTIEERDVLTQNAMRVLGCVTNPSNLIGVLEAIGRISPDRRTNVTQHVLDLTQRLRDRLQNSGELVGIIDAIIHIPVVQRAATLQTLKAWIDRWRGRIDLTRLMEIISAPDVYAAVHFLAFAVPAAPAAAAPAAAAATFVNVHARQRDENTKKAVEALERFHRHLPQELIAEASAACVAYFQATASPHQETVLHVLLGAKGTEENFGPLLDGEEFGIVGKRVKGDELLGHIWMFIQGLSEERERENAICSLALALVDCAPIFNRGPHLPPVRERVCNQGKTQRIMIGVVQGRLEGVRIDEEERLTAGQALMMFFDAARKEIVDKAETLSQARALLLVEAEAYLATSPQVVRDVSREAFLAELERYLVVSGLED